MLSKRGDIAAHVSLCLMVTNCTAEAATNKECPVNDEWARTPKHADIDENRVQVATHD